LLAKVFHYYSTRFLYRNIEILYESILPYIWSQIRDYYIFKIVIKTKGNRLAQAFRNRYAFKFIIELEDVRSTKAFRDR